MTIDNIFDIQSEITRQIVTAVKGELSAADQQSLGGRPTDSLAAWEAWLHAENIIAETDYSAGKYQRAEPFARKAVEEDPGFADAWITLATIQMQGIWIGFENTEEQRERVRQNLARAEAIAPNSPNVKAAQADYHYRIELDYGRCLELLEEAIGLAPGVAEIHRDLGLALRRLGRWQASVAAFERTLELDPLNSFAAATLAETLALMNDWARLGPLVDRWLTRDPDSGDLLGWKVDALINGHGDVDTAEALLRAHDQMTSQRFLAAANNVAMIRRNWDPLLAQTRAGPDLIGLGVFDLKKSYRLGLIHAGKGELETARSHFSRYIEESSRGSTQGRVARAFRTMNLATAQAWLGNADTALALAELASTLLPLEDDHVFGANIHRRMTWLLAFLGQRDAALKRIAAKLDQPEGFNRWQLHLDPRWDFFRDDPRFNDLARPEGIEADPFRDPGQRGGP
jgi:tetratricopeptide (TPR) repeat protein